MKAGRAAARYPEHRHPSWCGHGHVCSADRPGGEHRSTPMSFDTTAGRVVATRLLTATGRNRLQFTVSLDLPADANAARCLAGRAVDGVLRILHGGAR